MDRMLDRVKDMSVLKPVRDFWGKRIQSKVESELTIDGNARISGKKEKGKDDSWKKATQIDFTISPGFPILGNETTEVLPGNHLEHERPPLDDDDDHSMLIWDPMEFIHNSRGHEEQGTPTEFPLTSKWSKIFTFHGQFGYQESALSLTDMMVWQMNKLFRNERKEVNYGKEMGALQAQKGGIDEAINYLTRKLEEAGPDVDKSRDIRKLEQAQDIDGLIQQRKIQVLEKMQLAHDEMEESKDLLFNELKRLLDGANLLDPPPPLLSPDGSATAEPDKKSLPEIKEPEPLTPSEAARIEWAIARENAEQEIYEKEAHLHDVQQRLDHWHDYYEARFTEHCKFVEEGITESSITAFDNHLLMEHNKTTRELIQAENAFDTARETLIALGTSAHSMEFYDHSEDRYREYRYRESMEAEWIQNVDHGKIQMWIDTIEADDGKPHITKFDEWEFKDVGNSDSVSMIALGKDRTDIDRWRELCELVEIDELAGGPETTSVPDTTSLDLDLLEM